MLNGSLISKIGVGVGAIILLLVVFKVGVIVGYKKAGHAYRWGESYDRLFGGPRRGFFRGARDRDFMNAHGISGVVLKVDGETIILKGTNDIEQSIAVDSKTIIRRGRETIPMTAIAADDRITVIGDPGADGKINARFIR
ncbi:hypothetical protein HY629_00825, partial [Candidatus Uhrbacteria bacterium]|nr:hypothetical protein [Candidatus Uhrbacteria bacterium]